MNLSTTAFRWMLATVALAILPHAFLLPWETLVLPLAVLALRGVTYARQPRPWPLLVRGGLVVLMLVGVFVSMGSLIGRGPGSAMLIGMMALKATEAATQRDARVGTTVAMFLLITAFLGNQSALLLAYGAAVSVVMFAAIEIYSRPPDASAESGLSLARLVRLAGSLLLLAVPFALLFLVLFPRWSTPLWGMPEQRSASTGMSDTMEPGTISQLYLDDTPVMRVRFDDGQIPPPIQRYFRVAVLWQYDGRTWERALGRSASEDVRFRERTPTVPERRKGWSVMLDGSDQRFLPALESPLTLEHPEVWRTADGQFQARRTQSGVIAYRGVSDLSGQTREDLLAWFRQLALQLPPGRNPKTVALGREWAAQTQDVDALVQMALNKIRSEEYYYSLEPPPLGANAMDEFLFDYRSGYCEHYSSAFVTLMRAAGVPARVVLGFQGGIVIGSGGYLLIRRSDAHAWAEVWHPQRGWQRVDPTAAIDPSRIDERARGGFDNRPLAEASNLGVWAERYERLRDFWNRTLLGFNYQRQQDLLRSIGLERGDWRALMALLGGGVLILALTLGLLYAWRLRRQRHDPLRDSWLLLRARLLWAGLRHELHEPPEHLHARARERFPGHVELHALIERWEALAWQRPAGTPVDTALLNALRRDLRRLQLPRVPESQRSGTTAASLNPERQAH
jgi:transglutaminase-like putative cysteine protease